MNYKERVGLNINYYRKLSNLTLKEVADRVGVTEATMQKYEAGQIKRVDIEMLENIANAIETTAAKLTGWLSKEDERAAHKARVSHRNDKWKSIYEKLPFEKQKSVNNYMVALKKGTVLSIEVSDPKDAEISQDAETIERALAFMDRFEKASPEVRAAIETLLKVPQSDT